MLFVSEGGFDVSEDESPFSVEKNLILERKLPKGGVLLIFGMGVNDRGGGGVSR